MGQCTSTKSGQIIAFDNNNKKRPKTPAKIQKQEKKMEKGKRGNSATRGEATLFGFKRPVVQPVNNTPPPVTSTLPSVDATVTRETIEPLVIPTVQPRHGTPKLTRAKKTNAGKGPNRFGFRSPAPLSNKVADMQQDVRTESEFKESTRPQSVPALKLTNLSSSISEKRCNKKQTDESPDGQNPGKFTLHYSQLPRPQCALRVASAPPTDKRGKTAANNQTATRTRAASSNSSSESSDSSASTQKRSPDSPLEIQQLDQSPSMNKFRSQPQKSRPIEMVFNGARNKTFEIQERRDNFDSREMQSSSVTSPTRPFGRDNTLVRERREMYEAAVARGNRASSISRGFSSDEDIGDEGFDESAEEDKQNRDRETSEKDTLRCVVTGDSPSEEMWGHGEAMAMEEEMCSNLAEIDNSPEAMNPPLRSVLLTIEDPTFATLAAMSNSGMLEDEVSPETLDLSCSPPSVEPLPPPPNLSKGDSPESPGTPTHASNSLSSDRDRDFLIDDEIADQPGLVFNQTSKPGLNSTVGHDMSLLDTPKSIANLAGQVSRVLATISSNPGRAQEVAVGSTTSVSTLSPCESITSDDLMVDFDRSDASNFEDLNDLDETELKSELENQSGLVIKEWNSILSSHPGLNHGMKNSRLLRPRIGSTSSTAQESPHTRSNLSSPLRTIRMDATSPGDDLSDDSGIRVDRGTYQHMFQDVINIKTMLLRLKRVLQESETINPFDNNLTNGLYCGLASSEAGEETPQQLADLRRQVVLLQHQLEEKNRTIQQLQEAVTRSNEARPPLMPNSSLSNAATQTDRIRPLSTGPTTFKSSTDSSSCSLVSYLNCLYSN